MSTKQIQPSTKKAGRPVKYTKTLIDQVFTLISQGINPTEAVKKCKLTWSNFYNHVFNDDKMKLAYEQARHAGADFKISEYNILLDDLKESVKNDTKLNMSTIKGLEILQKQIQWQASRSASTMYGDSKDRITLTNGDQSFSIEWSK
jgi:hypothetical protein